MMKLVWCPETAGKAHIDAVKILAAEPLPPAVVAAEEAAERDLAELVAAMAGGWRSQCIVETWHAGSGSSTSLALAAAAVHTGARHVCVVPDDRTERAYAEAVGRGVSNAAGARRVEVVSGEAEAAMKGIDGVDFLVVDDCGSRDGVGVLRAARLGSRGAVLVCKGGGGGRDELWRQALMAGARVVRAANLPIGEGVEIVHVGVGKGTRLDDHSRWIKHVDRYTGEEHVFRR